MTILAPLRERLKRKAITMSNKNLYVALVIVRDPASQDITGMARPVIAETAEEALRETQDALFSSDPSATGMDIVIRDAKEIPRTFVEEIAKEILRD